MIIAGVLSPLKSFNALAACIGTRPAYTGTPTISKSFVLQYIVSVGDWHVISYSSCVGEIIREISFEILRVVYVALKYVNIERFVFILVWITSGSKGNKKFYKFQILLSIIKVISMGTFIESALSN